MNISSKLIKMTSLLLIILLIIGLFINVFLVNEVQAKSQNTKEYKKGSNMLDDYPGYAALLDDLLDEHPNWSFTILYTGLDWDTVIKNETTAEHGRNLVQNKTGEWVCSVCGNKAYDNGSWRCASTSTVSYYMDPRNSLFEDYIFQFENLEWKDNTYTLEGVEQILDGTYLDVSSISYTATDGSKKTISKSYAKVIMEAAEQAGISPYHLASRIVQEQGSTGSATSTGTYSTEYRGYYNFLNVNATGSGSATIIKNALAYAKRKGWTDPEKSIKGGAEFLAEGYISIGQNTLYLQKFDVDDSDGSLYWHQYQQNVSASKTESTSIMKTYKEIDSDLDMSFNFLIPVFKNMPGTRCAMPGTQSIVTQNIQITDSSVVVYKSKDTGSAKLKTLKKNDTVLRIEIGSEKGNGQIWDKVVLDDGTKGYIISKGFKVIDDVTNCEITGIAVEPGNLRNGPGTSNTTILTTLTVGQRVTIIEKGKYNNIDGYDWSRVILADGTQGYIVARYVEEVSASGTTSDGSDIVKVVCSVLRVRKEPTTSSGIVAEVDRGDYLTRIEKAVSTANGYTWDKVVTGSGKTGYVARGDSDGNYIEPVTSTGSAAISGSGFKTTGSNLMCEPATTVSDVLKKASDATIKDANGKKVTSGNLGTGYTISYNGTTYTIVKLGDTTGNGEVDSADLLAVQRHLIGKKKITNTYQLDAADATNNGRVDSADLLAIQRELLGKIEISL